MTIESVVIAPADWAKMDSRLLSLDPKFFLYMGGTAHRPDYRFCLEVVTPSGRVTFSEYVDGKAIDDAALSWEDPEVFSADALKSLTARALSVFGPKTAPPGQLLC